MNQNDLVLTRKSDRVGKDLNAEELKLRLFCIEEDFNADSRNFAFLWRLINSKIQNKAFLIALRQPVTAERFNMTPQEQLYADFFKNEKARISAMNDLELDEHIEELQKITFEARARLDSAKDGQKERRKKANKGFAASVQSDELSSNAINAITERNIKLSKREKLIAGLMKQGVDRATAELMVPADKMSKGKAAVNAEKLQQALTVTPIEEKEQPTIPFTYSNPFAKTEEPKTTVTEVTIVNDAEAPTIIVTKTEDITPQTSEGSMPFVFTNPFAAKQQK